MCLLFVSVYNTVDEIEHNPKTWSKEAVADAQGLRHVLETSDFVFPLVLCKRGLGLTRTLCVSLQSKAQDICRAYSEAKAVMAAVEETRRNVDAFHDECFQETSDLLSDIGSVPRIKRRAGRQQNRDNIPADTPSQFYKRSLTIPFLEDLASHMQQRFSGVVKSAILGLALIPSVFTSNDPILLAEWKQKLGELATTYKEELPNPDGLSDELKIWEAKWTRFDGIVPETILDTLPYAMPSIYPNINTLLRIVSVLPVTTCSCERCISMLRLVKTYLRSSMCDERLNGLALMKSHYDMKIYYNEVLNIFARKHPRRLELLE